jgi:hypothetical protein
MARKQAVIQAVNQRAFARGSSTICQCGEENFLDPPSVQLASPIRAFLDMGG